MVVGCKWVVYWVDVDVIVGKIVEEVVADLQWTRPAWFD